MLTKPGLTALLLIAFTVQSLAQPFFSREQVIADIDDLYLSIDEIHPDMFYEYPKRRFERDIRRIKQNLPERLDLAEVYNQLLPLVANLNDGHTGLSYKPDQFGITKHLYLPLKIRIDKNDYSWRVEMDLSEQDHKIPAGAHILSVNSRPAEEITANLIRYVSGEKESFKIAVLNNGLRTNQLLYIRYREPQFDIEYTFDGQRFSTTLHSMDYNRLKETYDRERGYKKPENYTFYIHPDTHTGILELNSMSDPKAFKVFADSVFRQIRYEKIKDLIIDVRNNGGGNSGIGDELLRYISPVPYAQFEKVYVKHSRIAWKARGYKNLNDGKIEKQKLPKPRFLLKNNNRFTGNVYLLISNGTFSSGSSFSWAFQYLKIGTLIGEETGGLPVTFGDLIRQKLPNTQIEYFVSHKLFYGYGATKRNRHGVKPDYQVPAEDALDFTLDLIRENQRFTPPDIG